jgi:hypothetical protein
LEYFSMKKTLIALAVLAASGASFAQVSITGKLGFSYQKNAVAGGGAANHGMQMTDGDLNFKATEDLGSGMSLTASSAFVSRGRDTGITARDASLTLVTGAGVFMMGSVEAPNGILNTAGAPVSLATGHDNSVILAGASNVDMVAYYLPVGPVTVGLSYADSIGAAGAGAGNIQSTGIGATYAAGPLKATLDFTAFTGPVAATVGTQIDGLTRTRLSGSYDLGMAVIGAGVQVGNHDKPMETSFSVNVPVGAMSVGLLYSNKASQGATAYTTTGNAAIAAADSKSGTAVGATYNLSKTANFNASYGTYTTSTGQDNEFRLRLMKSF